MSLTSPPTMEDAHGKAKSAKEDYLNMSQRYSKKVRVRKIDPLHQVIKAIQDKDAAQIRSLLASRRLLALFKKRLQEPRVPKDHSPLVTAILSGDVSVFTYIVEGFGVNVEQETSAVIEGGYPVEGASPLWTASTLGKLEFVKLLVEKGANIEHTTDSKSSPLRGAAFDGHCDVCEFLIDQGADIDKPNQVGQSPLTIAAAMKKRECVELLIKQGADVNHKGHNGDTPLHVSVESGDVEIAKLLVDAGANNNLNDVGFTPAILACCYGHKEVMKYLNTTFKLESKELYDCYCLLAAKEVLGNNQIQAETYMRTALDIRLMATDPFDLPQANPIYDDLQEPSTYAELQNILSDETRMFFLSSICCERILGRVHPTTAFYIRISGDMVLADDRYMKCIDLWHRSLDFDNAARMAYELQITEDLLFAIRGFFIMCTHSFIPPVEPHFRWGLKELHLAHESKIPEVAVISCLFRMIAVWIEVIDHIVDNKEAEKERVKMLHAVDNMIDAMDGKESGILTACLHNLPEHSSGAGKDIVKLKLPLHKAIAVFLDKGCSIHCEDELGNFPLHLATKLLDCNAPKCVRTLLDYGAHFDAVNFNQETSMTVAKTQDVPTHVPQGSVLDELNRAASSHISLQCLSARAVVSCSIPYLALLPPRIIKFVAWHEGDIQSPVPVDEAVGEGEDVTGVVPCNDHTTKATNDTHSVPASGANSSGEGAVTNGVLHSAEDAVINGVLPLPLAASIGYILTKANNLNTNPKQGEL